MVIDIKGKVITASDSYVKIKNRNTGAFMIVGPNSKLELSTIKSKKRPTIVTGMTRFISGKKKRGFVIRTQTAGFGIRGTDFVVIANELLEETEIVTFDGKVKFQSFMNKKDRVTLKKNQWGGLGGRFGNKIGKILNLSSNVVNYYDKLSKF